MRGSSYDALLQTKWAILPEALDFMAQIAKRENDKDAWEALKAQHPDPQAVQGKFARPIQGTARATLHGNVAVIPLVGPVFPRANMMTNMSGATSLASFSHDFNTVLEDDGVEAIVLDIDSPGGVAFGPGEMADMIKAGRAVKPIVAYVSGMAASAAYWIASAATEIVAHRSAELGSIGVVSGIPVQENPDVNGYRYIEIVSSNAENKRPDPRTEDGMAEIRNSLDGIEGIFIGSVAENRNVSVSDVKKKFGRGGVMIASKAVEAGLADRIGSFEDVLSSLKPETQKKEILPMSGKETSGAQTNNAPEPVTAASIRVNHADAAAQIEKDGYAKGFDAGKKAGSESERDRIAGIDELSRPGCESIIRDAKADGVSTKADVALKILDHDKTIGANYLAGLEKEAKETPEIKTSVDTGGVVPQISKDAPLEDRAKADWDNDPSCRAGYPDFDTYLSYRKGVESGKIRIKSDLRK